MWRRFWQSRRQFWLPLLTVEVVLLLKLVLGCPVTVCPPCGNNDTNSSELSDGKSQGRESQSLQDPGASTMVPTPSPDLFTPMGQTPDPSQASSSASSAPFPYPSSAPTGAHDDPASNSTSVTTTTDNISSQSTPPAADNIDIPSSSSPTATTATKLSDSNTSYTTVTGNTVMKSGIEICLDPDCVKASARLMSSMNPHANPCDDFFEYACGTWNKLNVIPEDKPSYNTFSKLRDDLQVVLKELLEVRISPDEGEATKKAKYLYQSCVNETLIDSRGLNPAFTLLEEFGGWPVVNGSDWDETSFDLVKLLAKLRLYNNKILIEQWVGSDDKQSDTNIIQIDQPELGMPSRDYYLKGRDDAVVKTYEDFARQVAIFLGAEPERAAREMKQMVDLEVALANITIPQDQRRDSEALYNKMTVGELADNITGFDWRQYLNLLFNEANMTIEDSEEVVVYAPQYLIGLMNILEETDNRTLANYLIWRIMMNRVNNLPEKYRSVKKEYNKVIFGSKAERARWRDCVTFVNDNMGNAVGRLFIEEHFDEGAKHSALDMIAHIRHSFYELLEEVTWMNDETRRVAKDKAEAISEKIGFPEYIKNNTALDYDFGDLEFDPNKYFENILANIKSMALNNLKKLREPVDRTRWSTTPAVVNAFYSSPKNQIMFPAGILQPPFYSKGYPKSLNFGGIGMVIGHEITHGFDDRGRQFDKNGNLKQWWSNEVIERFKDAAQCIVDQYSNFTLEEVGMNLNGIQTQGENIADNGGLKEAYRAYSNWVKNERDGQEEPRLPGLENFSHEQLFFLNFAQVWCGTIRPQEALNRIRTGVHSPGRFRVIGTLQNSRDFSSAFNCEVGSHMNPAKKCSVW
ncbi:neprilysin-like isoform X2 [Liolophura sinensis]|uniref:neprilysin-like isoform X2 n=1 Tax=Liolophura sinensis TaxID=3198878 RepID=UPI0031589E5D